MYTFSFFAIYIIGIIISVLLHEYAHVLVFKKYGGNPKLGCALKGIKFVAFVTPLSGEKFYWDLFSKDEKNAWKKQLLLNGSGMAVTLILGIVLLSFCQWNNGLFLTGLLNAMLFIFNFFSKHSDGRKMIRAIRYNSNLVKYLKDTNYKFVPDEYKEDVEKVQRKYGYIA